MGEQSHTGERVIAAVESIQGSCPVCAEPCVFAAGRGYCRECSLTFAQPRPKRHEVLKAFQVVFLVSKQTGVYHHAGCKYLRNVARENIIETTEPYGRACVCVKASNKQETV